MLSRTISPHDSRLVVEHSDMTGGYITRDNGQSWRMVNLRGGIDVFAFDPADPRNHLCRQCRPWRSGDSGRTWRMVFPNPARDTVEHQLSDDSDFILTSGDPVYPGGEISAIAVSPQSGREVGSGSRERLYVSFQRRDQPAVIVSSADGGASWSRFATVPQRVLLLTPHGSGLTAVSGSAAFRIAPTGSSTELGGIGSNIKAASAARQGDSVWTYATGQDGKVYLSKDSGLHWETVTPVLHQSSGRFEAIAACDRHPEVAYAGFRGLQLAGATRTCSTASPKPRTAATRGRSSSRNQLMLPPT